MRYVDDTTALAYFGAKDAALYFDYVVPASHAAFGDAVVEGTRVSASVSLTELPRDPIVRELLPPSLKQVKGVYQLVSGLSGLAVAGSDYGGTQRGWAAALLDPDLTNVILTNADAAAQPVFADAAQHVSEIAALERQRKLALLYDYRDCRGDGDAAERLCVTVSHLQLVDTSKLSWEEIHEFRKDEASRAKLSALRRFVYENYAGKDPAYVRDDLMARISEYESAAKLWNFGLGSGLLSAFANEGWVSARGAALAGGLTGGAAGALATGTAVLGSQVALKIAKRRHAIGQLRKTSPLGYIIELREKAAASTR